MKAFGGEFSTLEILLFSDQNKTEVHTKGGRCTSAYIRVKTDWFVSVTMSVRCRSRTEECWHEWRPFNRKKSDI